MTKLIKGGNSPKQDTNRWTEMFGTDVDSPAAFLEYLKGRFWEVRGRIVDAEDREFRPAPMKYIRSLVRQSGFWEKGDCGDITKGLLDDIEVADDLGYKPVQKLVLSSDNGKQVKLNQYKAPSAETTEPTDEELRLWSGYWESLIPNEQERTRLMQWAAHLTYKPEQRTGIVVLVHGTTQGTGKSTLGDIVTSLVGEENSTKPANAKEALTGRFNSELEGKVLFSVDELYAGENYTVSNAIKSKVTEARLSIERKGIDSYAIDNYCNFYANSNHLTPVALEEGDRRWEVYSVEHSEEDTGARKQAVVEFRQWFESDKVRATKVMRHLLAEVDLSNYNPCAEGAMFTTAKRRLIEGSVSAKQSDFEDYWYLNKLDEKLIFPMGDVFQDSWSKTKATERTSFLLKLGCKKLEANNSVRVDGAQKRNWWISPKGLAAGMSEWMDGKQLTAILKTNSSEVLSTSVDEKSGEVDIQTIGS